MTDAIHIGPQDIIDFWFVELSTNDWFAKSDSVDAHIKARFEITHRAACACELSQWRETPLGRLAEIIVLDQFSRNIFRDEGRAFAADALALCLAQEAIAQGHDVLLDPPKRAFLYLPFMHSESRSIHKDAMRLFAADGLEDNLEFERKHKAIIDRFDRYPHRNAVLGRVSSPEEIAFLREEGSSF